MLTKLVVAVGAVDSQVVLKVCCVVRAVLCYMLARFVQLNVVTGWGDERDCFEGASDTLLSVCSAPRAHTSFFSPAPRSEWTARPTGQPSRPTVPLFPPACLYHPINFNQEKGEVVYNITGAAAVVGCRHRYMFRRTVIRERCVLQGRRWGWQVRGDKEEGGEVQSTAIAPAAQQPCLRRGALEMHVGDACWRGELWDG